jgi:hypothetical protein
MSLDLFGRGFSAGQPPEEVENFIKRRLLGVGQV